MSEKDKSKFKEFCREILPFLENISDLLNRYYPEDGIEIRFDIEGYITFYSKGGWRFLRRDSQAEPEVRLEISEPLLTTEVKKPQTAKEGENKHDTGRPQVGDNSSTDSTKRKCNF